MYEQWNNNTRRVNGSVKPPMVLRSEAELFIAQQAHNLVWDTYWDRCAALDAEIERARRNGLDTAEPNSRLQQICGTVKQEIDALIIQEIENYRAEKRSALDGFCDEIVLRLSGRVESLQSAIDDMRCAIDDVSSAVETLDFSD